MFGLERVDALLQELGYVPGVDYEADGNRDRDVVCAFVHRVLEEQQVAVIMPPLDPNDTE
jgi:hypothetical protein